MKFIIQKLTLIFAVTFCFLSVNGQQTVIPEASKKIHFTLTASTEKAFFNELNAENLEVYFDNKRGEIISLKQKNEPVSIGFVIDTSASMREYQNGKFNQINSAIKGILNFLEQANGENEYFVVSFDKTVNFAANLTQDKSKIKSGLIEISKNKLNAPETVLFDSVKAAYEKLETAKHQRKILVLVTDGQDNASKKLDLEDIKKIAKRRNIEIYAFKNSLSSIYVNYYNDKQLENTVQLKNISLFQRDAKMIKNTLDPLPSGFPYANSNDLDMLCELTGGRVFYPLDEAETISAFNILAEELKNQFVIEAKTPSNLKTDNFNELKVKFSESKKNKKVSIRTRKGFYF